MFASNGRYEKFCQRHDQSCFGLCTLLRTCRGGSISAIRFTRPGMKERSSDGTAGHGDKNRGIAHLSCLRHWAPLLLILNASTDIDRKVLMKMIAKPPTVGCASEALDPRYHRSCPNKYTKPSN